MKSYKEFAKESIGSSDIGALVLVGGGAGDIQNQFLFFGEDGSYRAYMVTGADVEIGSHYEKVAAFKGWLRIYDDDGKTFEKSAAEINVYRSGDFGCIIQTL